MRTKRFFVYILIGLAGFSCQNKPKQDVERPKLVIGIVIDQMRWDYLYRYYNLYGEDGFKRLLNGGFSCENTMLNYIPAITAVGHTSIYTGTVPSINGIVGNDFIPRQTGKSIYCVRDDGVKSVGIDSMADEGRRSPKNLLSTTITDELRLATNFRSKVIGVALKDRASILPAGRAANAAFWFDGKTGKWITSTYYMEKLPQWLNDYNAKNRPEELLTQDWNTAKPIDKYVQSSKETNRYERFFGNVDDSLSFFPVKISKIFDKSYNPDSTHNFELISSTPFGNTMTLEVAEKAIEGEQLGEHNTDFLAISLSATDYIGHRFGVNSAKTEDCYLRLDKDLAEFLTFLDKKIGKGNYTIFLTADHGCAHNTNFMNDNKLSAGIFNDNIILENLNNYLTKIFKKEKIVISLENYQVNFDYTKTANIPHEKLIAACIDFLEKEPSVQYVVETKNVAQSPIPQAIKERIINGYNSQLSGEIQIIVKPAYYSSNDSLGCSHGTWNPHDSHIPLIFYGWGIRKGTTCREVYITDIAPTLAALLKIQMPNGCIGKPIFYK